MLRLFLILIVVLAGGVWFFSSPKEKESEIRKRIEENLRDSFLAKVPLASGFDFPVGKPDARGYYDAQKFRVNNHLGEDWNAVTGGNSDLGQPVWCIGDGRVVFSQNIHGGWGNIVRVIHKLNERGKTRFVESIYAHMKDVFVDSGEVVKRGQKIGTIGNNDGMYAAHLHLELRDSLWMEIGGGYDSVYDGFIDPTKFIKAHRPVR